MHILNRCTAMCLRNGVVDSTGAGDAYIGGFLAGLLNNYQIQVRIEYIHSKALSDLIFCQYGRHVWHLPHWLQLKS